MSRDNKFGLVVGDKVECISDEIAYYDKGEVYLIGFDSYGDFGVLQSRYGRASVRSKGCILEGGWLRTGYYCQFSFDNFRKVE